MNKKWSLLTSLVLLLTLVFCSSVFAFTDLGDEPEKDKIESLKKSGIIGGIKEINPNGLMTREQFANYLFKAISTKGDFAYIEIWIQIADEKDINKDYMDSIQKLLISKIAKLDKNQKFNPKKVITRAEAAIMLHDATQFIEKNEAFRRKSKPG